MLRGTALAVTLALTLNFIRNRASLYILDMKSVSAGAIIVPYFYKMTLGISLTFPKRTNIVFNDCNGQPTLGIAGYDENKITFSKNGKMCSPQHRFTSMQ